MASRTLTAVAFAILLAGCNPPEIESGPAPEKPAPAKEPVADSKPTMLDDNEIYLPDGRIDMSGVPNEPPMTNGTPRPVTAKDPLKGKLSRRRQSSGGIMVGMIPLTEHKMIFEQIPGQLEVYNLTEGGYPKSHEDFMNKFIVQYGIKLPELEPGDEYLYDPVDNTLKIWRPGDAETTPAEPDASEE